MDSGAEDDRHGWAGGARHAPPPTRRRASDSDAAVLGVLSASDTPLTAYQIVEKVTRAEGRIAPMQVYRVLERLIAAGRAMRVECASAYTVRPATVRAIALCERCGRHILVEALPAAEELSRQARAFGFETLRQVVELIGICAACGAGMNGATEIAAAPRS